MFFSISDAKRAAVVTKVWKKMSTDVQQQRQPGDPLHGEDEEGDHGQASALAAALDLLQALSEGRVAAPDTRTASRHPRGSRRSLFGRTLGYSQQLLQSPLLEGLVGAVDDVGFKVIGGVVLNDVADVSYHWILIVTSLQVLKKP